MNSELQNKQQPDHRNQAQNEFLLRLAQRYATAAQETLKEELVSVVLFGSVARGEAHADSDIDLLFVINNLPPGRRRRKQRLAPAREALAPLLQAASNREAPVSFTELIYTPQEARQFRPLYLDMTQDALILYDRNEFFQAILETISHRLAELKARRIRHEGEWYWDLKPGFQPGEVVEL